MKRISISDSRRNSARRKRKVAARHGQAGHWQAQPRPMLSGGKVHYEVGAHTDAMSYGGIGAVHRLVTKLGLPKTINASLSLLKVHLPYHESDHACLCVARLPARSAQAGRQVLNIAYNVLCGGTRLEDIERLRHDGAYMNALGAELIPDPTTAGDFCRRFEERDIVQLLACINAVRPSLWESRGRKLLGDITYIDVDGTQVPTCLRRSFGRQAYGQRKAGMDISYQGIWGYHPLVLSLANTKEVLYVVNRPGNVPSHKDAAQWIDAAIAVVQPHAKRICLRGDTDFSLTRHFDRWAKHVDFIFGMDCNGAMRSRAEALDEADWRPMQRKPRYETLTDQKRARRQPGEKQRIVRERAYVNLVLNHEHVAEFNYQPTRCQTPYRVVALRKNISKMKGENVLFDEIRYYFYITTRTDLSPAEVVACANQRCDQENVIEQLKNGVNALRVPLYDLVSNWAYLPVRRTQTGMVIAALAWNIKSWFAMMMHRHRDRQQYVRMEFRRFIPACPADAGRRSIILIPCHVVRRARGTTLRLIGYQPTLDRLFSTWRIIERTGFG